MGGFTLPDCSDEISKNAGPTASHYEHVDDDKLQLFSHITISVCI